MQALFINMDENQNNSITFSGGLPHQSLQKSVKQFMESNKKSNYGSAWNTPRGQNQKWQLLVKVVCIEFQQKLLNIYAVNGKVELQYL